MQRLFIASLASLLTLAPVTNLILPEAAQVAFAAEGTFVTDAKNTEGTFKIVEENGKTYVELSDNFRTGRGPDVFVLLHREATPTSYDQEDYINLGMMSRFRGTQRYEIPEDVNLDDFQSVVIWCRQFDVTFGHAKLEA